jgi:hypothetical protein
LGGPPAGGTPGGRGGMGGGGTPSDIIEWNVLISSASTYLRLKLFTKDHPAKRK